MVTMSSFLPTRTPNKCTTSEPQTASMAAMAFVSQRLTSLTPLRVRPLAQSQIWQGPGQARHTMRERHDMFFPQNLTLETIRLEMYGECSQEALERSSLYFVIIYNFVHHNGGGPNIAPCCNRLEPPWNQAATFSSRRGRIAMAVAVMSRSWDPSSGYFWRIFTWLSSESIGGTTLKVMIFIYNNLYMT